MTGDPRRPFFSRGVLVAAALTWIVIAVRITGEMYGGPASMFSTEAGGGAALIGISWLMPVFGFLFAWGLASRGAGPDRIRGLFLIPLGTMAVLMAIGFLTAQGTIPFLIALPANAVITFFAALLVRRVWPEFFGAQFAYGLLARLPIAILTFPAVFLAWGTHLEGVPPFAPPLSDTERALGLAFAQLGFWVPFTVVSGAFFAGLAVLIGGKGRRG